MKQDFSGALMLKTLRRELIKLRNETQTKLLVAVSGGPDSMALLHGLLTLGEMPAVVHIHHGIRVESDDEEKMVTAFCEKHGVECVVKHVDAPSWAREKGLSLETAARQCRYETLRDMSGVLVLAHHAGDQAETLIQHLLRGSGLDGLRGMATYEREMWRPLLNVPKAALMAYCDENSVPYAQDMSNEDVRYSRNWVRHVVLPMLEEFNPQVEQALGRTAELLRVDAKALDEWVSRECEKSVRSEFGGIAVSAEICALPKAIAARLIRKAWGMARGNMVPEDLEMGHVESLMELMSRKESGGFLNLPGGWAWKGYGVVLLKCEEEANGKRAIAKDLETRIWKAGDRIRLAGGEKKISDLLTDKKVQPWLKKETWVGERDGKIVWVGWEEGREVWAKDEVRKEIDWVEG